MTLNSTHAQQLKDCEAGMKKNFDDISDASTHEDEVGKIPLNISKLRDIQRPWEMDETTWYSDLYFPSDFGGEIVNNEFKHQLKPKGIHDVSLPIHHSIMGRLNDTSDQHLNECKWIHLKVACV